MSKVQLQGNVSGTGVFTIASPNSNTDRTLTLPDNTGTLLTNAAQSIPKSALPTGSVLQVVTATVSGDIGTTLTTYTTTNLFATITPTSNTSRILCLASSNISNVGAGGNQLWTAFYRGTSGNGSGSIVGADGYYWVAYNGSANYQPSQMMRYDSPASTSALTYTVMQRSAVGGSNVGWCFGLGGNNLATLVLMEIAA
jgi:hypothetical protein